jgi:hypothetical protein
MPLTESVSFNLHELKQANAHRKKKRSRAQMMAISLEAAREHGAKIQKKK